MSVPAHKIWRTGEVGRLLNVNARTVGMWCDTKLLYSFRNHQGRRIPAESLAKFMKQHDMWNHIPAVARYLLGLDQCMNIVGDRIKIVSNEQTKRLCLAHAYGYITGVFVSGSDVEVQLPDRLVRIPREWVETRNDV